MCELPPSRASEDGLGRLVIGVSRKRCRRCPYPNGSRSQVPRGKSDRLRPPVLRRNLHSRHCLIARTDGVGEPTVLCGNGARRSYDRCGIHLQLIHRGAPRRVRKA